MATPRTTLTINCLRDYISAKGNVTFVYSVDGTPDALATFADIQGDSLREDEDTGKYLWFTTRYAGERNTLIVNADTGKMYADMSAFRKQASLAKQFGGNLGNQIAQSALGKLFRMKDTEPESEKASA